LKHTRLAAALAATTVGACSWIAGVSGDVEIADTADAAQDDDATSGDAAKQEHATEDAAPGADADLARDTSDIPDGGPAPDGAIVLCGRTPCTDKEQVCCYTALEQTCQAIGTGCDGGSIAHCDEAIDCDAGQVCCVTAVHAYGLETLCKTSCDAVEAQACRTHSECPGADCVPWACAKGIAETCGGAGSDAGCVP
jgi:hypothetical protein